MSLIVLPMVALPLIPFPRYVPQPGDHGSYGKSGLGRAVARFIP
jgi:hypothetical protein